MARTVAPYGSWHSPITPADLAGGSVRLAELQADGEDLLWLEGRPADGGRQALVRRRADGTIEDVSPPGFNVRTRVHEYGGGSYLAAGGLVVASEFSDGRLHRLPGAGAPAAPLTPAGPWRYADPAPDPARPRVYAVREDHGTGGEPRNEIVALALDGPIDGALTVLAGGHDFVAAPRPSPDGRRLAWLTWDHPAMPWDATELWVADVRADGSLGEPERVAGGPGVSVLQPEWGPDGRLVFVADWTGWWNLYRWSGADEASEPLAPAEAEFADPAWVLAQSSYARLADGSLVAACRRAGRDLLVRIAGDGTLAPVVQPFTEIGSLRALGNRVAFLGAAPGEAPAVVVSDPATGAVEVVRRSTAVALDPAWVSVPVAVDFPTAGGATAHALFYPPVNPACAAPTGERPPVVVTCHGGPTANASTGLALDVQLLTSRGIAVLDVDYRGSTGYGRPFRDALRGAWGIADLEDCVAAARHVAAEGWVDGARMAIEGGSAGGYTTLRALTAAAGAFAAGISFFGVGDLEALARDTHKFESRYLDGMIGPYPERADLYRERSPIHAVDRIRVPVLVLQGLDDRVVPPAQAEVIVAALRANRVPVAALFFEGEGHGFRGAPAIVRSAEAELAFLAAVFGFTLADPVEPLEIEGFGAR